MLTGHSCFTSKKILALLALIGAILIFTACESTPKTETLVSTLAPVNKDKPRIKNLLDLGGLDITPGSTIPTQYTDKRFSPGEWVAIEGSNLGVENISIDGIEIPITKYFGNYPLFQVPKNLKPLKEHTLLLRNEFGSKKTNFDTRHYIVSTDTDGKEIYLIRTNREEKGGVEEEWLKLSSDAKRPLYTFFSKDSRFLFSVNVYSKVKNQEDDDKNFQLELTTYHVAAPDTPEKISTQKFTIKSSPIDALINTDGTILLLGKSSLTLIDASDPIHLKQLSEFYLPKNQDKGTSYVDAIFLNNNNTIALLETYNNQVVLLDVSDKQNIAIKDTLALLPGKAIPLSVDLEPDPMNPTKFWVLIGPNYRLAGGKIVELYKRYIKKEVNDQIQDETVEHYVQAISINENTLVNGKKIATPEDYATFFGVFGQDGRMYISATKMEFFNTYYDRNSDSSALGKVGKMIWNAISFGRIVALNLESGETEDVSSGVGVYYHLIDVPDIGPVFSLMKFGPSFSFPYLKPVWGIGIKSTGTYSKRKLDKYAVFPPYSLGYVDFQY